MLYQLACRDDVFATPRTRERRSTALALLRWACRRPEDNVGVAVDHSNGSDYDDENDPEGDRVFGDVLSLVVGPEPAKEEGHVCTSLREMALFLCKE